MSALASVRRSGSGSANQPSSPQDASGAISAKNMVSTSCFENKLGCQTFHTFGRDHTCSIEASCFPSFIYECAAPLDGAIFLRGSVDYHQNLHSHIAEKRM